MSKNGTKSVSNPIYWIFLEVINCLQMYSFNYWVWEILQYFVVLIPRFVRNLSEVGVCHHNVH
jgi:hypothetical protein